MNKLRNFYELSKPPVVIGAIASILFALDSILAEYLWSLYDIERGFMWIAFVAWTISFGMKSEERVRMWIGHFIGFLAAVGMIYFGQLFDSTFLGIGLAALIGVFLFNGLVMFFANFKRYWLNSITGIFMGIFLTFSGLGVGLGADTWSDAGMTLAIILLYSLLGCTCAYFSVHFMGKWKGNHPVATEDVPVDNKED